MALAEITKCSYCNASLTKASTWVALNRHVVNCKDGWTMITAGVDETYFWDIHDKQYSASSLCFPHCLMSWIEGEMVELRVDRKKRKDAG